LLLRRIENERYVPAGRRTVPPPAAAAASIALLIDGESSAFPSPFAPNARRVEKRCEKEEGNSPQKFFHLHLHTFKCGRVCHRDTGAQRELKI
jgi:hypothetical protein